MYTQQINISKTANELDQMLYDFVTKGGLIIPVNKTTFKYRNYLIVNDNQNGWSIFYLTNIKNHVASTFLKVSAFAICKAHEAGAYSKIKEIKKYDSIFEKNYLDSVVFKHTINHSSNEIVKDTALCRFELVQAKAKRAKQKIDNMFYSSLA
jgi:hypothetical protein